MTEVGVHRTDSQRLQQQNGPRVSFNRDVHVKRIAKLPNESTNYPIKTKALQPPETSHLRRELPTDLSNESILKEAALVLAQAESVKCKADSDKKTIGNHKSNRSTNPNKFNSLPSRKKVKATKPVSRSVSDISSKKTKKPSIFSIFSRKSDTSLNQIEEDARFKESGGRRIIRSKSNADEFTPPKKITRKRNISENEDNKGPQLSPIIENSLKEDYFAKNFDKSNPHTPELIKANFNQLHKGGNIGYINYKDSDLIPQFSDKENISHNTIVVNRKNSPEDMHSSQIPPPKPPLTKGLTVDGMVKRLSLERFSPPPVISTPAFSYTRPNDPIIYAQLAPELELDRNMTSSPSRDMNLHRSYHSKNLSPNRIEIKMNNSSHGPKSEVYLNGLRNSSSPLGHNHHRVSPREKVSEWRHLTPKNNLSDDDEGLGFETRKYYEDELPVYNGYNRSKSPSVEPPIVPYIRNSSPLDLPRGRGIADGMDARRKEQYFNENYNEFNNLSNRREALESKFRSRKVGAFDPVEIRQETFNYRPSPSKEFRNEQTAHYYTPERELVDRDTRFERELVDRDTRFERELVDRDPRFEHELVDRDTKFEERHFEKKHSPEKNHPDMVSPKKSSKYIHTKYFNDGTGGVKEIYEKETKYDEHGKPHTFETRKLERLDSPQRNKDPLLATAERYRLDCGEPKSIDSQFSDMYRSSPEHSKRIETARITSEEPLWQTSLIREKRQQRSFDKGDSGIENDFRKESFNSEFASKWRRRTTYDDIKSCETFLKKEQRHTEEQHPKRRRNDLVFRERSIDDGSHFDPRLDKYSKENSTLKRNTKEQIPSPNQNVNGGTLKREKKLGGFEKVKKLFSSSKKKEHKELFDSKNNLNKDHYLVQEQEMRSRYDEYRPEIKETKVTDISMRRRLSTPKASPLLKRIPSDKSSVKPSTIKSENEPPKTSWFKSLDRKNKKKSNLTPSTSFREDSSTLRSNKKTIKRSNSPSPPVPSYGNKNLRFFGDTDLESNPPTISKSRTTPRHRPKISTTLNRTQKYSQSAYDLDRIPKPQAEQIRSNSLQNLEEGVDTVDVPRQHQYKHYRHHSRSRNLANISESGSETEDRNAIHASTPKISGREPSNKGYNQKYEQHNSYNGKYDRDSKTPIRESLDLPKQTFKKPPPGPPKPARSVERGRKSSSYSRERERVHDSSGTEGESSLHSQRSVVYLHATTVGDIPQPAAGTSMISSRRRTTSRDDLRSKKNGYDKPMTKTVSRSVSMLAPWTPKKLSDGYEINYSQDNQQKFKSVPRKNHSSSNSNLARTRKSDSRSNRYGSSSKEDLSSKSGISSTRPAYDRRSIESRKSSLNRRRIK